MSLALNTTTPEGMVLAADSRQSFRNRKGMARRRIGNLRFVNDVTQQIGQEEVGKQLRGLEYVIQWGTMTLQDAIDFCALMIQTTSAIQRFSDGIAINPGDMPGVGDPVDVAVITSDKGFVWINKKELKVGGVQVDLNKE